SPSWPWRGSAALRVLSNALLAAPAPLRRAALTLGLAERRPPPWEMAAYGASAETREMWNHERALLPALRDAGSADGARLAVLYVPARWEIDDEAWRDLLERYRMGPQFWQRDRPWNRLERVAAELSIPLGDPRAALREADAAGPSPYFPKAGLWTSA